MRTVKKTIIIEQRHNEWLRREVYRRKPTDPQVSESQLIREALDKAMQDQSS